MRAPCASALPCLALALVLAASASAARAQGAPPAKEAPEAEGPRTRVLHGEAALQVAVPLLVQRGEWRQLLDLLASLPPERRAQADLRLIEAQALRRTGQPGKALDIYRRLLGGYPDKQLIRLELAQTLYEAKDLRAAEENFRLALAGRLPETDRQLAHAYLARIVAERPWRITGAASIAPDSNLNGATDARQVQVFGLPFALSDEARRQGGVALSGSVAADGGVALKPGVRLVGALTGDATVTSRRALSDEAVGARLGPEFSKGEARWSALAVAERRWFAGAPLYLAAGASLQTAFPHGPATVYSLAAHAQHLDYDLYPGRTGWLFGADALRTRYLGPQSFWRAGLSARFNRAAAPSESYDLVRVSAGLYRPLPLGLAVYAEPWVRLQANAARDPLFGVARRDRELGLGLRFVKPDYSVMGFAPYVGASISRNDSNIVLYAATRQRFEMGVSRSF